MNSLNAYIYASIVAVVVATALEFNYGGPFTVAWLATIGAAMSLYLIEGNDNGETA